MERLGAAIDELAAEDVHARPSAALADDLIRLEIDIERLHAEPLRRLGAFDAQRGWAVDGSRSCVQWLRSTCRVAPGAASDRVRAARALRRLPETERAFATGTIGYEHVRQIVHAQRDLPTEAVQSAETTLVDAARRLDPSLLRRVCDHWRHAVEPEAFARDVQHLFAARRLDLSETFHGLGVLDGRCDPEGFATISAAVHALSAPGVGDARLAGQRRYDALVELCRRSLDAGGVPVSGGEKPHVNVHVSLETLEGRRGADAATLDWSGPVSGEAARRLACDAAITRIITDGPSEVLDVGRTTRVVPAAVRRAVIARHPTCVEDGCDVPGAWCDLHHIVHWIDGGSTSVDNLEPRCRRHHRAVHEGRCARAP